ncbi:uncharacterized protein LOC122092182 [Macadamia integrifolia]|uniref:uncharacterized protein LOC122092182 n=1 Tax=Macadamia integrifolia TaxID=60698 RepID=UPI001C4EF1F6|nr:uncharacterized protein LOC122092182 [Macadamia integrifolia]
MPFNYKKWQKVPQHYKESIWEKDYYEIEIEAKKWVRRKMGIQWKDFRLELKEIYDKSMTIHECFAKRDVRFALDQWKYPIDMWRDVKYPLQEIGEEPLKVDFYKITHIKKNLELVDEESGKKLKEMEDKLEAMPIELQKKKETHESMWTESFGEESHGRVHLVGVGVSPKDIESSKNNVALNRKNEELQNKVEMLEEKMELEKKKNEDVISSMQSQIEKLTQFIMN